VYSDADYTFKYSNQLEALDVGEKACVLMFDVLPGKSKQFTERQLGCKPTEVTASRSVISVHSLPIFISWTGL
jgi:hypothetical protein